MIFQAWVDEDECSVTLAEPDTIQRQIEGGLLSDSSWILHSIEADDFESAIIEHNNIVERNLKAALSERLSNGRKF